LGLHLGGDVPGDVEGLLDLAVLVEGAAWHRDWLTKVKRPWASRV